MGWFSTKKITHYHSQSFAPINGGWLPDPVATAAMSGVTNGGEIVETIQNEMKYGVGAKLRQYYQYGTRRFKKRNVKSYIITRTSTPLKISYISDTTVNSLVSGLDGNHTVIVQEWATPILGGAKFFWDMKEKYGLDAFSPPLPTGEDIAITELRDAASVLKHTGNLGTSWVVGRETTKNIPVVILDPSVSLSQIQEPVHVLAQEIYTPVPSMGAVYWTVDKSKFVEVSQENVEPITIGVKSPLLKDWGYEVIQHGSIREQSTHYSFELVGDVEPQVVSIEVDWEDPRYMDVGVITGDTLNTLVDSTEDVVSPTVKVTRNVIHYPPQKLPEVTADTFYDPIKPYTPVFHGSQYDSVGTIDMEEEGFIWVTADGSTNTPGAEEIFKEENKSLEKLFDAEEDTSGIFKWYPYLPTKEVEHNYANLRRMDKYVNALKAQNDATDEPVHEIDAPKVDRDMVKAQNSAARNSPLSSSVKRILKREPAYLRKIGLNNGHGINQGDLRHFKEMGKLLGVDWAEFAAQDASSGSESYLNITIPSVPLGSNSDEVNTYWWEFWNRVYNKMHRTVNARFETAVNRLPNDCDRNHLYNLPLVRLHWESFQLNGFMGFTCIHKFRMKGRIRRTKGKRRLKEVRAGKLVPVSSMEGNDMKYALLNPPRELMPDMFHTKASGKEYNVGILHSQQATVTDLTTLADKRYHTIQLNTAGTQSRKKDGLYGSNKIPHSPEGYGDNSAQANHLLERDAEGRGHASVTYASQAQVTYLATERYGYTFICKPVGNGDEIDVIAIGGLVGGFQSTLGTSPGRTDLRGHFIAARAHYELALFHEENKNLHLQKWPIDKANVFTSFKEGGGKNGLVVNASRFFLVPLEYNTYSRMSSIDALRLAPRAVMQNTWQKQRVKRYRGWIKTVLTIIGIIVTIVVTIHSWGSGTFKTAITFASIITAVAKAVAIQLIVRWGIKALVRAFGLKGIILLIVAIVAMAVARNTSYFGQMFSSLPMASQTATAQIATNATQNVMTQASQSLMQQLGQALQTTFQQSISEFVNASGKQILIGALGQISTVANEGMDYFQSQQEDIRKQLEAETSKYNDAIGELVEAQEELEQNFAPYDVTKVLSQFKAVSPLDMDMFLGFYTMADNTLASLDYLSGFLDQKSNIEAEFFNIDDSINFSLGMKYAN